MCPEGGCEGELAQARQSGVLGTGPLAVLLWRMENGIREYMIVLFNSVVLVGLHRFSFSEKAIINK